MRQAIEIRKYSACEPKQPSWQSRLRGWLFGGADRRKLLALDRSSAHLLRDIGLGEDLRTTRLLEDYNFFRR